MTSLAEDTRTESENLKENFHPGQFFSEARGKYLVKKGAFLCHAEEGISRAENEQESS